MDTMIIKLLTDLGFTKEQAKMYRSLLELGEATVAEIAEKSGVKRSSAYYILEQLKKDGVVYETKYKKRTFYVAEKPDELLDKFQKKIDKFSKNIELLRAIENQSIKKPRIYLMDGLEGFKKVWKTIFDSGLKEFQITTDPREFLTFVRKGYITNEIIKKKVASGIKSRQLVAASEYAKEVIAKDARENRISKVLPHIYKIPFTTIIFGDKVAYISAWKENMIFIIESDDFAKTQKSMFDALWEKL